jgi:hypothetical protein
MEENMATYETIGTETFRNWAGVRAAILTPAALQAVPMSRMLLWCGCVVLAMLTPPDLVAQVPAGARTGFDDPARSPSSAQVRTAAHTDVADGAARLLHGIRIGDADIRVDGVLDEPAWHGPAAGGAFVQRDPHSGSPATERTEVRVLYSANALYVGVRAFDSAPDRIRGELVRRDQSSQADEIAVYLDTYDDRRTAFMFAVNPRGSIRDVAYSDDSEYMADPSWDPVWQVRTSIDSLGWSAEFRIPLTQLRFDSRSTTWGLQVHRRIHRTAELAYWAPYTRDASGFVSRFGRIAELEGLTQPRRLEVRPYSVLRGRQQPESTGTSYTPQRQASGDAGFDLQYGITSNLTLDLTVNPDFGQVEADPAIVNLTAFESYLPERRPFFVEGSAFLSRSIAGGQPFYSRRIGRSPQGWAAAPDGGTVQMPETARILGAGKVSGKTAGGWGFGMLGAVTSEARAVLRDDAGAVQSSEPVEPRTYSLFSRLEKDFRQGRHTVGSILTALRRDELEPLSFLPAGAYLGSTDGAHRWGSDQYSLTWNVSASHVHGSTDAIRALQRNSLRYYQRPDARHLDYDPERTSLSGYAASISGGRIAGTWRYTGWYDRVSPGFSMTDLGFQWSADAQSAGLQGMYVRSQPQRMFRNYELNLGAIAYATLGDEITNMYFPFIYAGATLRNNWRVFGNPMNIAWGAKCVTCLRGGPSLRTDARRVHYVGLSTDRRRPVSGSLIVNGDSYFDSPRSSLSITPTLFLRPNPVLNGSLGIGYAAQNNPAQWVGRMTVADGPRYVLGALEQRTLQLTSRVNWTLSPGVSVELYAQPFVSAGSFGAYREVVDPQARRFADRYRVFGSELQCDGRRCEGDVDGDGTNDFGFTRPDFNVRQIRSTMVTRWEYRPGSVLYIAWQHGRSGFDPDGRFGGLDDLRSLAGEPADNTLLVKANYWLSF